MVERGDRKTDRLTDRARERNRERDRDGGGERQTDRQKEKESIREKPRGCTEQTKDKLCGTLPCFTVRIFFFFKKKINGAKSCST